VLPHLPYSSFMACITSVKQMREPKNSLSCHSSLQTSQEQAGAQSEIRRKQHTISGLQQQRRSMEAALQQAREKLEQQTQAETSERDQEIAEKQAEINVAQAEMEG
jgi:septal ring factor EnvC (AmiA/AmiB activator)